MQSKFILAVIAITLTVVEAADFYSKASTPKTWIRKNSDWMGYILPTTLITDLSIPGTHDTCARSGGAAVQCQSWTIPDQLAAGIRFLDIRARHFKNGLPIHHDLVYLQKNFDQVLSEVTTFLTTSFRETVFIRLKQEYKEEGCTRSFAETVEAYLAPYKNYIYRNTGDELTTLSQARGKIVILRNYEGGSYTLGPLYNFAKIGDDYKVYETWLSKENKKRNVSDNIMGSILRVEPSRLRITFMSGSTGVSPEMWGKEFNQQIQFYYGRLGIVLFDFPGEDAIDHIVSQNFIYQSGQLNSPEWNTLWGGLWGDIKPAITFTSAYSTGYFACGVKIRVEAKGKSDDTAANGLQMKFCNRDSWNTTTAWVMVQEGNWGDWFTYDCPNGSFINGGEVRFQEAQIDGSDTALNGLRINCKNPKTSATVMKDVHPGYWGDWKGQYISPNKYVCNARVRWEGNQLAGDDTALNGITFKYCSLY